MASISRRGFLKFGSTALLGLSLPLPSWNELEAPIVGRVLDPAVRAFDRPRLDGKHVASYYFDQLIPLLDKVEGTQQPEHNPIWYRTEAGSYLHSSSIQWTEPRLNPAPRRVPQGGFLGEVTLPHVDARWKPAATAGRSFRLYYSSVYWVRGLEPDADGPPWYKLYDERLGVHYYVPSNAIRRIPLAELQPLSPTKTSKRIEVDLTKQTLVAYEGSRAVLKTRISSGRASAGRSKSLTPVGEFLVERKKPSRHMGFGELSADSEYELPGVPWVSYFHWSGVAFHGTYWHNDFGRPRSQGCVNLPMSEARWLFRWTQPVVQPGQESVAGDGTPVRIYR